MNKESAGNMLIRLGMDGDKWAREFIKMFGNGEIKNIDLDLMRVWFCNSIMAGYDRGWYDALYESKDDKNVKEVSDGS